MKPYARPAYTLLFWRAHEGIYRSSETLAPNARAPQGVPPV